MERLTEWFKGEGMTEPEIMHNGHRWGPAFFPSKEGYKEYDAILSRLAAYEDTGLEPEEIQKMKQEQTEREKKCEWCNKNLRFECNLIDDEGNTASIENNVVQTCIAKFCPVCGRRLNDGR